MIHSLHSSKRDNRHCLANLNDDPGDWIFTYASYIKWANLQHGEIAEMSWLFMKPTFERGVIR